MMYLYFFVKWLVLSLIPMFTAWLVPGIEVKNLGSAFLAAAVIGLLNTFIKPLLLMINLPTNPIIITVLALVVNALLLLLASYIVPGFKINGFLPAVVGVVVMTIVTVLISMI